MTLAFSGDAWTQLIVALSIFVPVVVTIVISIFFLRSAKNDPDEQRWRRLAEQQREADAAAADAAPDDRR
jgi:heme/copper-type cytochrome/quinol oxidase subunit 2